MDSNTLKPFPFYTTNGNKITTDPFVYVLETRDPTAQDVNYPQQKVWINLSTEKLFILTSFSTVTGVIQANWTEVSSSTADINTLTGDDAVAVSPVANNINVVGAANGALETQSGGAGILEAKVNVDNATIVVNGMNQLSTNNVLLATNNLSDVTNAATARSNLGLTAVATQTPTQYAVQVGGAANSLASLALGNSGQILTSNGPGANPSFQTNPSFTQTVTQVFTSNGTYTPTSGMKYCTVEVIGGGGGSGAISATGAAEVSASAGGGGGGYAKKTFTAAAIGVSQAVTIGAGGIAGTAGGAGGNGGTTTFGALLQATGGSGSVGGYTSDGTNNRAQVGGDGGVGSLGDINVHGSPGGSNIVWLGNLLVPGTGGTTVYGGGAVAAQNTSIGTAGTAYGSGASGSINQISQAAKDGAAGASGVCIITEFL